MNLTDEAPKLAPWPFLAGDAVLLGTAALIARQSPAPLSGAPLLAIVGCVGIGAALACIPFLLNYTRRQDLALAERQNEIAALARVTADSAEQIGIAAQGLQSLAEITQRSLKHLDQLPQKLQEKINDFKTQLNEVAVTENEALAQEVNTLRTSEIERLETAFASVRKTTTELAALETATRQQLADFNQSLARFAQAAERTTTQTAAALETGRNEASRALSAAQHAATTAFEKSVSHALAALEKRLAGFATPSTSASESPLHPPLSPRTPPAAAAETAAVVPPPAPAAPSQEKPAAPDLPPSPERPPEISHVTSTPPMAAPAPDDTAPVARKRPPRKSSARDDDQPSLGLDLADASPNNEYSQPSPEDDTPAPAVSADGLTRLLVTAYIGIGNKLFVRGEGPGLSWEKGAPLQFVSIGKWRWETADAVEPLTLQLYKNDEQACASPAELTLAPGHQQEVRANF